MGSRWYWRDGTLAMEHGEPGWQQKMVELDAKMRELAYKRVAITRLSDGKVVSTVWLGLDHNYFGGPPLIFETMVFPSEDDWTAEDSDRYSTEAEARAGHEAMVAKWSPKH